MEWAREDPERNPKIAGGVLVVWYILIRIFEKYIVVPKMTFIERKKVSDDDARLKLKPGSTIITEVDGNIYMDWAAQVRMTKKGYLIMDNPPFDWAGHETNRTFYIEVPPGSKRHVDGFFHEDETGQMVLEYARKGQPLDIIPKMMGVGLNGSDRNEVCHETATRAVPNQRRRKVRPTQRHA